MIDTEHLHRVRTIVDRDNGTEISDGIQERDPDTLFPLQAALGYDIAQNLFIGKANLLVEGVSDLLYVTIMSAVLEKAGREHLANSIVIVPVGGADKVATFISLLKGNKLKVVCLLDTIVDPAAKQRLEDMVRRKIIKESAIRFCGDYVLPSRPADVEDFFTKEDYLKIFVAAYPEHKGLSLTKLDASIPKIVQQISGALSRERYNHYRPANTLATMGIGADYFQKQTLDTWEAVFKDINKRLD